MRSASPLALVAIASLAVASVVACGSSHEDSDVSVQPTGVEPEGKPNPCSTVKCPDAKHCVAKGKTPTCVDDPPCTVDSDCYLSEASCSPSTCDCVAHESGYRLSCSSGPYYCTGSCTPYLAVCVNGACGKVFAPTP